MPGQSSMVANKATERFSPRFEEHMRAYRYSRWDGSQDIEPFTADDLMQEIADEMLEDGDLQSALRRLLQRGAEFPSGRRMMGLQELLEKMRNARGNAMQRYNLGSIFDDIKE